jgi:hypothetical protein
MKNRDSKEIEEIRTIISAEHKSYEERFIELFNLKADRRELTKLTDYLNGNFLTMEKGTPTNWWFYL